MDLDSNGKVNTFFTYIYLHFKKKYRHPVYCHNKGPVHQTNQNTYFLMYLNGMTKQIVLVFIRGGLQYTVEVEEIFFVLLNTCRKYHLIKSQQKYFCRNDVKVIDIVYSTFYHQKI